MDAVTPRSQLRPVLGEPSGCPSEASVSPALGRGRIYHFLELAFAHPGEDGFDYFRREETEAEFLAALSRLPCADGFPSRAAASARAFFAGLRQRTYAEVEAAFIDLFSASYPNVLCPPYGSLFTAADDNKRLEEMLAIKQFYQRNGVDISNSFDDLPDHLCVELEFLQILCFREDDATGRGDKDVAAGARMAQAEFLDRFLLPFAERLAATAVRAAPDGFYTHLISATHQMLDHHRQELGERSAPPTQIPEDAP